MLFGREPEMAQVSQALAAARLGRSSRLVIRGEPGIGKSALLDEAQAQAGEMRILAAHGAEFEADVPFAGLHERVPVVSPHPEAGTRSSKVRSWKGRWRTIA